MKDVMLRICCLRGTMDQLLRLITLVLSMLVFASINSALVLAQNEKEEPLNPEWVRRDVQGVAVLMKLTPIENRNIEVLKKQLKDQWSVDEDWLGFGAKHVNIGKGYGYSSVYIDVLTFENKIAYYEIGVRVSGSRNWEEYRQKIIDAWKQSGGPKYTEKEHELTYQRKYDNVFAAYYQVVAGDLGGMKAVSVPAELKEAYDYLISPLNNSYVGEGICGLDGPVLEGKTSIDALINANRVDLITNVLRGYNPGGRIFAAIALLRMKREGLRLDPDVTATLNKVAHLNVPVTTCFGCLVFTGRKAKSVVKQFLEEW